MRFCQSEVFVSFRLQFHREYTYQHNTRDIKAEGNDSIEEKSAWAGDEHSIDVERWNLDNHGNEQVHDSADRSVVVERDQRIHLVATLLWGAGGNTLCVGLFISLDASNLLGSLNIVINVISLDTLEVLMLLWLLLSLLVSILVVAEENLDHDKSDRLEDQSTHLVQETNH